MKLIFDRDRSRETCSSPAEMKQKRGLPFLDQHERQMINFGMFLSWKKQDCTTLFTCSSKVRSLSKITPGFLATGLTLEARSSEFFKIKFLVFGCPNMNFSVLLSFSRRKFCDIQGLMSLRQFQSELKQFQSLSLKDKYVCVSSA